MISTLIKKALDNIAIPNYFITRSSNKEDTYCVYNYVATPSYSADNEEKAIKYTVMVNLYCKNNIENNKKNIVETMQKEGFVRKSVASTVKDDTGFFCTAITFTIVLHN